MKIKLTVFFSCFFSLLRSVTWYDAEKMQMENYSHAIQIAIQDFSKTKLFKKDSIFNVTLHDSLHRLILKKIDERNYTWVHGKSYPETIVVDIVATPLKYLLDTTARIDIQNKTIPSRILEKNGRVFLRWDEHFPLSDSSLKILDKFHLIVRGRKNDLDRVSDFRTDDSKRAADYYFCRNNLSVYKRIITNKGIGYYDPPDISCN